MQRPEPYVREAGAGPGVVCLHSNASTSGQWRSLMELLAPKFHVLAPDLYGAGKSHSWPADRVFALADEVDFLTPVFEKAGNPFTLVGHSYGAAVALRAAIAHPGRVRALVLYEPTLFALLQNDSLSPNEADGIRETVEAGRRALDAGDVDAAARGFIDYWMGEGSRARTPEQRKLPIAASMVNLRRWWHALSTEPTPLAAFRELDIPVLYLTGGRSPASAHGVARVLMSALPRVEEVEFADLGHMAPITDPDVVSDAIAGFLGRV